MTIENGRRALAASAAFATVGIVAFGGAWATADSSDETTTPTTAVAVPTSGLANDVPATVREIPTTVTTAPAIIVTGPTTEPAVTATEPPLTASTPATTNPTSTSTTRTTTIPNEPGEADGPKCSRLFLVYELNGDARNPEPRSDRGCDEAVREEIDGWLFVIVETVDERQWCDREENHRSRRVSDVDQPAFVGPCEPSDIVDEPADGSAIDPSSTLPHLDLPINTGGLFP